MSRTMSWIVLCHEPCHDLKLGVVDGNRVDGINSGWGRRRSDMIGLIGDAMGRAML